MSNLTIIICLLIVATASEAISLSSLKPEQIVQGSLQRKIALSEKEIVEAHGDAKRDVAAAVSAAKPHIGFEPQADTSRQEHPIVHERLIPKESKCSESLVAVREDGFSRLNDVLKSAFQYLEHAKNESLAFTAEPAPIFGGIQTIRKILQVKRTLPGIVAKAKSDFWEVVHDVKKNAKKESQHIRRCEKASMMARLDWSRPSAAPQEADDLVSLSSLEDDERPANQ